MNDLNNPEFYVRRKQQARELADKAERPEVRFLHLKIADEYAEKAQSRSVERQRLGIFQG